MWYKIKVLLGFACFYFVYPLNIFLNFPVISSSIHLLFGLFYFHVHQSSNLSSIVDFWLHSIVVRRHFIWSIFLNLLNFNLWPSIYDLSWIIYPVPSTVRKRVHTIGYLGIYCVVQIFYLLIFFCIVVLCIESGEYQSVQLLLRACLFLPSFISILSHIFWLLLVTQTYTNISSICICTFS